MKLRGHHLLCVFGWQGHGYSDDFNKAMNAVASSFQISGKQLTCLAEPDIICNSCPHIKPSGCFKDKVNKEADIKAHDKRVLDFLGLNIGAQISVKDLKEIIDKKKPHLLLQELCSGCEWLGKDFCYEGLEKGTG